MTFFLLLAIAGLLASLIGTWILVAVVAAFALPVYLFTAIANGHGFWMALGYVALGLIVFQISYGIGLIAQAALGRPGKTPPAPPVAAGAERRKLRVFGVFVPLIALYDVPCEGDGSPWDGQQDPQFRVTILVFGWIGRAISITVGKPWSAATGKMPARPFGFMPPTASTHVLNGSKGRSDKE